MTAPQTRQLATKTPGTASKAMPRGVKLDGHGQAPQQFFSDRDGVITQPC
ncbi:hypothetical protein [Rhodoferax ferrireducens]|nr:hypothetical protein [Rhodoferax ferrireducens]WPC66038.1 hypothetical protein SBP18_16315 [Rhodoferax ferrireducens]